MAESNAILTPPESGDGTDRVAVLLPLGAFAAGMTCATAVGYLSANSRVKEDTVMGIVFSGMFGFGLVLYTKIASAVHLDHILFGDMLGILPFDLIQAAVIGLVTTGLVAAKWRDLLLHAFDPAQARAIGLPALKATGIILTIALLIAPGAIAFLVTRRFSAMLLTAATISLGCSLLGVYASFFLDSAPAPTIVLLMSACFVAAFFISGAKAKAASRKVGAEMASK